MPIVDVAEHNFELEVLGSDVPVLVEFGAEWCAPCKMVAPDVEALSNELAGKAKVVKIDIDRAQALAGQMGIRSVPTFVVFRDGRPVGGKAGALRLAELRSLIEPVLPRAVGALKPNEVSDLLRGNKVSLVDTREEAVWRRSRIQGSVNLPLDEVEARLAELQALPSAPVLYCRAGDKTKELAAKLAQSGYPVSFIDGGVLGWEASGFTLDRPD